MTVVLFRFYSSYRFIIPLASLRVFCVWKAQDLQIQNVSRTNGNDYFGNLFLLG